MKTLLIHQLHQQGRQLEIVHHQKLLQRKRMVYGDVMDALISMEKQNLSNRIK